MKGWTCVPFTELLGEMPCWQCSAIRRTGAQRDPLRPQSGRFSPRAAAWKRFL